MKRGNKIKYFRAKVVIEVGGKLEPLYVFCEEKDVELLVKLFELAGAKNYPQND